MMFFLWIILLFLITVLFKPRTFIASDESYHKLLINTIKNNNHRFVTNIPNFMFSSFVGYPQFVHWILSFLNEKKIGVASKYMPIVINILSFGIQILYTYLVFNFLNFKLSLSKFLIFSMIIYFSNSILFSNNNARNTGISARGIGLLLGQLYILFVTLYLLSDKILYLLLGIPLIILIILSSQFAFQFIVLSIPIFSLLFKDYSFLLLFLLSCVLYIIVFPKTSRNYFKAQFLHKKWYFLIGSKTLLFPSRASIWGDFFYGFWNKLKKNGFKKFLLYVYMNPIITTISGIPLIIPIAINYFKDNNITNGILIFYYLTISGVILFLLTSFRFTRFLGEPERYLEFFLMPITIIGVCYFSSNIIIYYILIIAILRLLIELFIAGQKSNNVSNDIVMKLHERSRDLKNIRIFCNDLNITKKLFDCNFIFYWGNPYHDSIEKYKEIFDIYPIIKQEKIRSIIYEYDINAVLLEKKWLSNSIEYYIEKRHWNTFFNDKDYIFLIKKEK